MSMDNFVLALLASLLIQVRDQSLHGMSVAVVPSQIIMVTQFRYNGILLQAMSMFLQIITPVGAVAQHSIAIFISLLQ